MSEILPIPIDWRDRDGIAAARALITTVFDDPQRYAERRITTELRPLGAPFYRQFFAVWMDGQLVGTGGIKSADWATDTHILYLSAVDPGYRGRGIGRALVQARIDWLRDRCERGRIIVSTNKPKRYRNLLFKDGVARGDDAPSLMFLDF